MRFSAPRSLSPSPVRSSRPPRRSSTFGLHSDSEEDSDSDSYADSDSDSTVGSSSSDSFCYASESEVPLPPPKPRRSGRTFTEQRFVEDTVAAIRLRTRHHDPYEEWEKETRKDAFRTARKEQSTIRSHLHKEQAQARSRDSQRLAALHTKQMNEVETQLEAMRLKQQTDEKQLKDKWKERDRRLWERIEMVIKFEEEKVRARLEAERKKREEEDKRRREEEDRLWREEQRRREEEEKKRKEEEERRQQKEKEEEEKRKQVEVERLRAEQLQADEQERRSLGLTTSDEDWRHARDTLKKLKEGPMRTVKGNKELKSAWSALRRQITPKIGQLTNDAEAIARISQQLCSITGTGPGSPHPPDIYHAVLSSLAKAILLQAETEVTAEKRSAIPLALVTVNLLSALNGFADILFAKLVQRSGGWPVPAVVPRVDVDGTPWADEAQRAKALGYRRGSGGEDVESAAEYSTRVAGMMRVYFHILRAPVQRPLNRLFQLPRYWSYFARMVGETQLLDTAVAPQVLYAALDVAGSEARNIWGQQWIKMLALLYEGVTVGLGGSSDRIIGGQSPEGKAARVRVQLEVERIMGSGR